MVQGGPGTGKTAVALHRAAYLLYTHRFPLERQGVLVVGPNPLFLRYIDQVLPSLGESGVVLTTPNGMVPDTSVRAVERRDVARVKADVRMAGLISRAIRDRQRPLRTDLVIPYGPHQLRLRAGASAEIVATVKRRPGTHNARRRQLETLVHRRLFNAYQSAVARAQRVGVVAEPTEDDPGAAEEFRRDIRRHPELIAALERMWPRLTPHQLLHDLFGARPLVGLAAGDAFSDEEIELLVRPRAASVEEVQWTAADLPLLDEAAPMLGTVKAKSPDDGPRTYGHIIVDEAQDLTPMQLRMIARRSLAGSMTIVGDVAQATGPVVAAAGSADGELRGWESVIAHLPDRKPAKVVELSVNYRTPAEIMEVAGRVLAVATPGLAPPTSVRSAPPGPRLDAVAVDRLFTEAALRARDLSAHAGSVAIITAESQLSGVAAALDQAGVEYGDAIRHGLEQAITLVAVDVVKGLEFDAVVVVEPARVVEESHQGLRALYVALTRATKHLDVVHAEPLPEAMMAAPATADERGDNAQSMTASASISIFHRGSSRAATTTIVAAGAASPKATAWARPTSSASLASVRNMRVRTTSVAAAPASARAVVMISRHRAAWTPASSGQLPSGHTGAVPDTTTRLPTRTARLKPIVVSNGEPERNR